MSWATCYKSSGSNNIHFDFPPIMSDGRLFSNWQPEAVVNNNIRKQEQIKTNWQYRQYLTNNAVEIMKFNKTDACQEMGLASHSNNSLKNSVAPFLFQSTHDANKPSFGYNNSDLKSPYLSRVQLQSKMMSPSIQ